MQAENVGIIRCLLQSHCTQVIPHYMKASTLGGYLNVFISWECHNGLRPFLSVHIFRFGVLKHCKVEDHVGKSGDECVARGPGVSVRFNRQVCCGIICIISFLWKCVCVTLLILCVSGVNPVEKQSTAVIRWNNV